MVVAATAAADRLLLCRQRGGHSGILALDDRAQQASSRGRHRDRFDDDGLLFVLARGMTPAPYPGWISLLPGLFAQAGIAEEVLFRGYLFGHIRQGRTFWRAASLSMLPFVVVHLVLFFSMPWPIALASVVLAIVISFPLAYLYELGGNTIWAPALLHFVIQATVKVLVFPHGSRIVRAHVDGGKCAGSAAGLCGQSPDASGVSAYSSR